MSSSSAGPASKICFNSQCKEPRSDQLRRKGWRLRSGDLAELCDRCCCIYEQGIFCQTFHANATGWRNCEACGKRVHCGCIASASTYMLLDAGGVECITCARKSFVAAPNQAWPSPMRMPPQASERLKDLPANNWKHMTALWHEAPKLWNMYRSQSDLNRRISYELDRNSTGKQLPGCRTSIPVQEKKFEDMPEGLGGGVNHFAQEKYVTGNTGLDSISSFNMLRREEGTYESMQDSGRLVGENDSVSKRQEIISDACPPGSTGANFESYSNSYLDMSLPSSNMKVDSPLPPMGLSSPFPSPSDGSDSYRVSSSQSNQQPAKQFGPNPCGVTDSCGDLQSQLRIRPRVDNRGRHHLLPRYWPKISDKELRQISGDSNSVITPLFEKILSASDASRVGRLVLPKKCAEAYFPVISSPEGLPIKVQDVTGNEWIFQFRFWPNNNSRMYVLEGVTPCIQSMQLQAGDTVTFSRIDPEGKLVMGFRKASGIISEQDIKASKTGSSSPTPPEVDNRNNSPTKSSPLKPPDVGTPVTPTDAEDKPTLTNIDNAGSVEKDDSTAKSSLMRATKKKGTLGSKNKRLRIDKEESDQLKISWEEAQELFRAPLDKSPNAIIIDGHEIEEYEDAPVLGKPTIFITNLTCEKAQWAQCEDCSKWRKLPEDALLPFRWICSLNKWDPNRSSCTSPQELCKELQAMLNAAKAGTPKRSKAKVQVREISDGLDTLANLAILGEGESLPPSSSSPPTTKHPRHRPGCTCIVCIQPPSGKGRKHEPSCTCNVCLTVKRRFKTLMLRRAQEKKLQQQQQQELMQSPESPKPVSNDDVMILDEEFERKIATPSPLKAEIDLNIQPEREEDPSPALNGGNLMKQQHDTTMKRDVT